LPAENANADALDKMLMVKILCEVDEEEHIIIVLIRWSEFD
jgi:hypothetical protein